MVFRSFSPIRRENVKPRNVSLVSHGLQVLKQPLPGSPRIEGFSLTADFFPPGGTGREFWAMPGFRLKFELSASAVKNKNRCAIVLPVDRETIHAF